MSTPGLVDLLPAEMVCSTTGKTFRPVAFEEARPVAGYVFLWVYCPICDHWRRTRQDADYDPLYPQPHPLLIALQEVSS